MHSIRNTVTDPLELPPNVEACEMYGGCPYRANCNLSPGQIIDAKAAQARSQETSDMSSAQGMATMGLLAKLNADKARRAGAVTPPVGGASGYEPSPQQLDGQAAADAGVAAVEVPVPMPAWATSPVDPRKALGINPPESLLPPAPPVGAVVSPAVIGEIPSGTLMAAQPDGTVSPAKRRPGRPRKSTKDPVGADAAAHTEPAPSVTNIIVEPADESDCASVTVTWGKEKFQPQPWNDFEVGPFEATGLLRHGETVAQAQRRIYAELASFAEGVRTEKAVSYVSTLKAMAGVK